MKSLDWIFRLLDRFSGPAKNIAAATAKVTQQTNAAAVASAKYTRNLAMQMRASNQLTNAQAGQVRSMASLARAQASLNRASGGPGGGWLSGSGHSVFAAPFRLVGYYLAMRTLARAASAIGSSAIAIPKGIIAGGIENTMMKESTVAGMGVVLGDKARAGALVNEAVRFAAITPMTTEESIKGYQQLIMGGMAPDRVMRTMAAVSDLSSINMSRRSEAVETISQDLMQIMATGRVTGRHMTNLSHWGLPREEIYRQLAGGLIPQLKGASSAQVEAAITGKHISAEAFFIAFERAMAKKGGGYLGGISEEQSKTMAGLWSTLISRPQELLMNMDKTPGWGMLKTALSNLVNVLDYNTAAGSKIQEALQSMFSQWVTKLTAWMQDPAKVEKWVLGMLDDLKGMVSTFSLIAKGIASIAANLDKILHPFTGGVGDWVFDQTHSRGPGVSPETSLRSILADPNAPSLAKEIARQGLGLTPSSMPDRGINATFHIHGATEEGAKATADEVHRKLVATIFEQAAIEAGVVDIPAGAE
jgi:hypothetical protein